PEYKMLLTRTDSTGSATWSRVYGAPLNTQGLKIISASDSAFVLAGSTGTSGNIDGCLINVDTNGVLQWAKMYGGPQLDMIYNGVLLSDHGFLLTGLTLSFIFGSTWADAYA